MKSKHNYKVIGVMSGTSMDGLDLACCSFSWKNKWSFKILAAQTIPYSASWRKALGTAHLLAGDELATLHEAFGNFIGDACHGFVKKNKLKSVDAIASHGHTVFHQIKRKVTLQIGSGNALHAITGLPVVFDFRSLDVALGGEGAPLVPIGDRHLFGNFDVCINLGGIGNLSLEKNGKRIAYDFCYANMSLNYLTTKIGKAFDKDGKLALSGKVNLPLLSALEKVYRKSGNLKPSLGREGFEKQMVPLLDRAEISIEDKLMTCCESVAIEVARSLPKSKKPLHVLATGGGALNPVLMSSIQKKIAGRTGGLFIPSKQIIEFKEALVFAFLGVLRLRGEVNVLKSVTHASKDSCSGVLAGISPVTSN